MSPVLRSRRRCAPRARLHSIWYMGAKTRLLEGFIDTAMHAAVPKGGRVLDLFCGTGVVSRFLAEDYRLVANDAMAMCSVLAEAHLVRPPSDEELAAIDPRAELWEAFEKNHAALAKPLAPALEREAEALAGKLDARGYLSLLAATPAPGERSRDPLFRATAGIFGTRALGRRRKDPSRFPYTLLTAYYGNVYLGLQQAIEADSLRYAIAQLPDRRRRVHYLAALLHAVSISTSGTSHFAQPTDPTRDRERERLLQRRGASIRERFLRAEETLRKELRTRRPGPGHRVLCEDYRALIGPGGFRCGRLDAVYADPPYTADNYSRFYHVLEELVRYRYPELKRGPRGLTKGRYPTQQLRFRSGFCSRAKVEEEWRRLIAASARSGAALLASYATPNGLLLKKYRAEGLSEDAALERFAALFEERYRRVDLKLQSLPHSGQGDGSLGVQEILISATGPQKTSCAGRCDR